MSCLKSRNHLHAVISSRPSIYLFLLHMKLCLETGSLVAQFLKGEDHWDLSDDKYLLQAQCSSSLSQTCTNWSRVLGPSMRTLLLFSRWRRACVTLICNCLMGDIFDRNQSKAGCKAMALATRPLSWTCSAWRYALKGRTECLSRRYHWWHYMYRSPQSDSWDSD